MLGAVLVAVCAAAGDAPPYTAAECETLVRTGERLLEARDVEGMRELLEAYPPAAIRSCNAIGQLVILTEMRFAVLKREAGPLRHGALDALRRDWQEGTAKLQALVGKVK